MSNTVTLEMKSEGVALVTMTNPLIHNQGSFEAIDQLAQSLKSAREGGACVAVIASGVEGHWLQHAYLSDLVGMFRGQAVTGNPMSFYQAIAEVSHEELTVIAAIDGDCSGGGAEIAWCCDLRVASHRARFCQPELALGLAPGLGGASRLARLAGRAVAAEMNIDGMPVPAQRLHALGVVNRLVEDGEATAHALAWAERVAKRGKGPLSTLKKQLDNALNLPLKEALAQEQALFGKLATQPGAVDRLAEVQARYDAGETMAEVHGWD